MQKIEKAKAAYERRNAAFVMASRLLAEQIRADKVGAPELYAWLCSKTALDDASDEWTRAVVEKGEAFLKKRSATLFSKQSGSEFPDSSSAHVQNRDEWSGRYRGYAVQISARSMAPGFSVLLIRVLNPAHSDHLFPQRTVEEATIDDAFNLAWHDAKAYIDGRS